MVEKKAAAANKDEFDEKGCGFDEVQRHEETCRCGSALRVRRVFYVRRILLSSRGRDGSAIRCPYGQQYVFSVPPGAHAQRPDGHL